MYVWARLTRVMATASSRGPYRPGGESRLTFRCLPSDVDPNLHLNNARYLMLADLGRMDLFVRSGLMRLRRERGWLPMMGGLQAAYLREIRLWRRFEIVSSFAAWTGTQIIGQHRFILDDGTPAATILTTAGIYDRASRKFVPLEEVVATLGYPTRSPPVSESEQSFLATHALLRNEARISASSAK